MPEDKQAHSFPFEVPTNFAAVGDAELTALSQEIGRYAAPFATMDPAEHTDESVEALEASATLSLRVNAELEGRAARFAAQAAEREARAARVASSAAAVQIVQETAATFAAAT